MKITFTATNFELTPELEKYAHAKVTQLARKVPRRLRAEAACLVVFSQTRKKGSKFNSCSITFCVSDTQLKAEEITQHMYSSLDVAAVRVANQLKEHADQNGGRHIRGVLRAYTHRLAR